MKEKLGQFLQLLQRWALPKQRLINRVLFALEVGLLVFWAFCVWLTMTSPDQVWGLLGLGSKLADVALILFCITLIPGIITRLRWQPALTFPIATMLTPFRRHLGILMFLTAFVHFALSTTLPSIAIGVFPPQLRPFEVVGMIGWMLLLPVWLTSNDVSMRKLGKKWKTLQRLTYVSIWFIIAHVALQGANWAILIGAVAILEVVSWVVARRRS